MVPRNSQTKQFGPPEQKWSLEYFVCPGDRLWESRNLGTKLVGDHLSRRTKFWGNLSIGTEFDGDCLLRGDQFYGDGLSRGINFMGIDCPGGQEVGDWKSGDQMGLGPNGLLLTKEQLVEYPLDSFQICWEWRWFEKIYLNISPFNHCASCSMTIWCPRHLMKARQAWTKISPASCSKILDFIV